MAACLAHKQRVRRAMAAAHTAQDELLEMMDGDALPADPAALERYARAQFPGAWELVARTDVAPPAAKQLDKYIAKFGRREPRHVRVDRRPVRDRVFREARALTRERLSWKRAYIRYANGRH